jgi:hypothetical protein
MDSYIIPPIFGWLLLTALVVIPIAIGLTKKLYRHWRIRQHMKKIPGPLLGVIYPEVKRK